MRNAFPAAFAALAISLASGCAFAPQAVKLNPVVKVEQSTLRPGAALTDWDQLSADSPLLISGLADDPDQVVAG